METLNETKAKEIAKKLSHPNIDSLGDGDDEFDTRFYHVCKDAALQAMEWKERQTLETVLAAIDELYNEHSVLHKAFLEKAMPPLDELTETRVRARNNGFLSGLLAIKDIITNKLKEEEL